ncbi:MAG: hypothetical protein CVU22_04825 [Betaproteobacteria bacterium HGW-Betaproteobacteria-16]|nr:MAG: hypothetical protein CVU22_04825 [Betaproteobacteria bacterium HGW-Betaproteobacteria-16]
MERPGARPVEFEVAIPMTCNCLNIRFRILVWIALCMPGVAFATTQVTCTIASIQMGALQSVLPLAAAQHTEGTVEALCTSESSRSQLVEFALVDVSQSAPRDSRGVTADIQVSLFADAALHEALPKSASAVTSYSTSSVVSSAAHSRVVIPFFARVYAGPRSNPGEYTIGRNISLVFRGAEYRQ